MEPITGRVRNGRYRKMKNGSNAGADLLILIGMGPSALRMLNSVPNWRERYGQVVAYIVDLYPPSELSFDRRLVKIIDVLFVSYGQMVSPLTELLKVPTVFIPQAADVLATGGFNTDKRIDVGVFGRQPAGVLDAIVNQSTSGPNSKFFAWWSAQTYPYTRDMNKDRAGFLSVLGRSRISLCYRFEDTHPQTYKGVSPITARWFESAASGCVIAGSRPSSPEGEETLNGFDSLIELSTDGVTCITQLQDLLSDPRSLQEIGARNFLAAAQGHDWGHRIAAMFDYLDIVLPPKLTERLSTLASWTGHLSKCTAADPFREPEAKLGFDIE